MQEQLDSMKDRLINVEASLSGMKLKQIEIVTKLDEHSKSCPLPTFAKEMEGRVNGMSKSSDREFGKVHDNFKTFVSILVTLAIILVGFLGNMQISKVSKDDFQAFTNKSDRVYAQLDTKLESLQKDNIDSNKQILGMLSDLKLEVGKANAVYEYKLNGGGK